MLNYGDIREAMAAEFPNIPLSWLKKINKQLGWLQKSQSGNADMHVHWHGGLPQYTEWIYMERHQHSPETE